MSSPFRQQNLTVLLALLLAVGSMKARAQDVPAEAPAPAPPPSAPAPAPAPDPPPPADAPPGEPGEITELPKLLEAVEADYPPRALEERVTADVMLDIDLDPSGAVENVVVQGTASAPGYGFEEAAAAAVRRFRFTPAMAGSVGVPVRISYRYRFTLKPVETPPVAAPAATPAPPGAPVKPKPHIVNLQGVLLVRGTREPIAGVAVHAFKGPASAPEEAYETQTDAEGKFVFFDLSPGRWNILVEADGFFPVRSTETIAQGERTELRYYVEKGTYNPFDVLVEADRPRREVNRTSLSTTEIETIPGTAGDVLQVIQNLPGVARSQALSGQIIVRGAAPEDTQTVVEAMNIPLIYHFGGLRSVIPTPMLKGIDFYPGNFSPEFGRAIGGIIDVRLKDIAPKRFGGKADVSIIDASLYLEAPIGDKAAVAIAARRSYLDLVVTAVANNVEDLNVVTAPRYYDAQALVHYRPAPGHSLRAFALLSDDQLRLLFSNPGEGSLALTSGRLRSSTTFYRGLFDYAYTPNTKFNNTLRLSLGTDSERLQLAQFQRNSDVFSLQLRETGSYRINEYVRIEAGIDHLYQRSSYNIYLPQFGREGEAEIEGDGPPPGLEHPLSSRVKGLDSNSLGAFALLELTFGRLRLLPGVRYDMFTRARGHRVSPRFTTRYALHPQWTLKGGVGLFYQEPTPDETDPGFGNPNLKPKGAVHYSAGFEYKPFKHLTFDATGFYKTLFDVVAGSDRVIERDGELVPENVANTGKGRVLGGEFLLRHELANNFSGWISYTVMRSQRKDSRDDPWRLFDYDQTHIFTALGTYRLPRNWEVGFRFRLVSGNPTTPVAGAILNSDSDQYEGVRGRVNTDRVPAFHQLDLRIDKHWIYDKWRLNAYLDIQNIYNRANPDSATYSFDFSQKRYAQGLPIFPILGLRAEY
jgi:TonB family protein